MWYLAYTAFTYYNFHYDRILSEVDGKMLRVVKGLHLYLTIHIADLKLIIKPQTNTFYLTLHRHATSTVRNVYRARHSLSRTVKY